MNRSPLAEKARRFRDLHRPGVPLVMPNAWDAASARIFEDAGFPAVATTSAGVAYAAGYPDGERIPRAEMLEVVARIARAVAVPVTADMETGHGASLSELAETVEGVLDAGAVGLNLEDGSLGAEAGIADVSGQVERIRAAKSAGARRGVEVFVNARTDVYLRAIGAPEARFDETIRRASAYRDAGADCVFLPGVREKDLIGALVERLACPVNVLAVPGSPSIPDLARLAVARVTLGSGPIRATLQLLGRLARELQSTGTYSELEGVISHADVNALMDGRRRKAER
jgi:2-methylisocitrate lyase-like PEP mutase family enzyme